MPYAAELAPAQQPPPCPPVPGAPRPALPRPRWKGGARLAEEAALAASPLQLEATS